MFEKRLAAFKSTIYKELWPSQAHVLDQFEAAHRKDPDLAIELPTGAGKTLIALLIADEARENGERVAILTPNKVLAQQVKGQAEGLPGYQLVSFSGSKYQFDYQAVRRYEDAEAVGIMNYWVYFNSSPGVSPADLLIIDDAHLVESPLEGLFALDLPRRTFPNLYDEITGIVLQINPNLQQVRLMREDAAPPTTPPHLLAFPDLLQAQEAIEAAITRSAVPQLAETKFSWDAVQPHLRAMTVLIGTRTIQIRPLIYPTQRERYYERTQQRIYLSATIGGTDDLQRRLGVLPIVELPVPDAMKSETLGRRVVVINQTGQDPTEESVRKAVLRLILKARKSVWLCASHAEADYWQQELAGTLSTGDPVWRLKGEGDELSTFIAADAGHLVTAGRYDGMDFPDDVCRLVILPTIPRASTELERFYSAYLRDASFMDVRVGQRIAQALGRANRNENDHAAYLLLDPAFPQLLATRAVRSHLPPAIRSAVNRGLALTAGGKMDPGLEVVESLLEGDLTRVDQAWESLETGTPIASPHVPSTAPSEVDASTRLTLGDFEGAAEAAEAAASKLSESGQDEHAAFWRYVQAHAFEVASVEGWGAEYRKKCLKALDDAIKLGSATGWFNQLRRARARLANQPLPVDVFESTFSSWDVLIERHPRLEHWLSETRDHLQGTHDQRKVALRDLGQIVGLTAENPPGNGATDCRWQWLEEHRLRVVTLEVKTTEKTDKLPLKYVTQALGQREAELNRHPGAEPFTLIATEISDLEPEAETALGQCQVVHPDVWVAIFERYAEALRVYAHQSKEGSAIARGQARESARNALPDPDWLREWLAGSGPRPEVPDW